MLLKIIYRTFLFYVLICISYKIMGKRELGELSIFDLVISILISQIVAIGIENYDSPISYSIIPILILVVLQVILSIISLKNSKIRNILDSKESLIINKGKLNFKEMIKQRYNLNDLLVQLREKSIKSIEEVEYAILETNGKLSVFTKKEKDNTFPLPIILDGKIENSNLKTINKSNNWVYSILKKRNILLENVFYAFYKDNELFIIKK